MDIPISFATNARRRFLMEELELLDLEIAFYDDYSGNEASEYFALSQYSEIALKRAQVEQELRSMKKVTQPQTGITDEDIDRARNHPITNLIEFKHGKASAFCHEDKQPSLYHATRTNRANCPVCDKSFDSIGVLMYRDNYMFQSAVKALC